MPRKGQAETRKVRRGKFKGQRATLISIRDGNGNIRNSYRPYSPAKYRAQKKRKRSGGRRRK
jgi:hypothetical protein